MAATGDDVIIDQLDFIFKSLADGREDGELYKEYSDTFGAIMRRLSDELEKRTENRIMVWVYGSGSEDLKSIEPYDLGDQDIMIWPNSDSLLIHEELLRYSLENPLHVRIQGSDHPVLQSCLVEGTKDVSTSALRNFHPAIFGCAVPTWLDMIMKVFKEFPSIFATSLKNNACGPAVTLNMFSALGTLSENLEVLKDPQVHSAIKNTAEVERLGRQYAECLETIMKLLHTIVTAPQTQCDDQHQRSRKDLQSASCQINKDSAGNSSQFSGENSMSKQATESESVGASNSEEIKNGKHHKEDKKQSKTEQPLAQKGEVTSKDLPQDGTGTFPYSTGKEIVNRFFDHLLGKGPETKEAQTQETIEFHGSEKEQRVEGGVDVIPAFRSRGWPKVALGWPERERKWPSRDIVDEVIQDGFHLVAKPPKKCSNPDRDFRISFSHAEYLLSQEMNEIQRECYRCLKKFHRAHLSTQPKSLVSFHLKNILLQTIEETSAKLWTEGNRAECVMKLLANLLKALKKKDLRHFFVITYNLFGVDYIAKPEILEFLASKVELIMENPMRFSKELIPKLEHAGKVPCRPEQTLSSTEPSIGHQHEDIEEIPSKSNDDTQGKKREVTVPLLPKETTQESSPVASSRSHDPKDICREVIKKLIDKARTGCRLETIRDPLERSLVEDLRELVSTYSLPVDELDDLFHLFWDKVTYCRLWVSTESEEPDIIRHRMLATIQPVVKTVKCAMKQGDFWQARNAGTLDDLLHRLMLDPSAENHLDLNNLIPSGSLTEFTHRLIHGFSPRSASSYNHGQNS